MVLTMNVCSGVPWNASINRMTCPFVEIKISFPSGLNFSPVQSQSLSCCILNVAKGPWQWHINIIFTATVWCTFRTQSLSVQSHFEIGHIAILSPLVAANGFIRSRPQPNTWFLGRTWVSLPNGISISSAILRSSPVCQPRHADRPLYVRHL